MLVFMMWNSIISNGVEYLVVMKELGFKSCVCKLCVILIIYYLIIIYLIMMSHNIILEL